MTPFLQREWLTPSNSLLTIPQSGNKPNGHFYSAVVSHSQSRFTLLLLHMVCVLSLDFTLNSFISDGSGRSLQTVVFSWLMLSVAMLFCFVIPAITTKLSKWKGGEIPTASYPNARITMNSKTHAHHQPPCKRNTSLTIVQRKAHDAP